MAARKNKTEALIYIVNLQFTANRTVTDIFADILQINGVQWVKIVFGANDAVALVQVADSQALASTAVTISLIKGVQGTETQVIA